MPDISQAPHSIMLGGKEYLLDVLTDVDIEELTNWLRSSVIQAAQASLTDSMTPAERKEVLGVAMDQARGLSWISGDGAKAMGSLSGVARVLWQGLKRRYPDLSHEDVRKLIMDPKTLDYAMSIWNELNVGPPTRKAREAAARREVGPGEGLPKANRRTRRSRTRRARRTE